MRIVNIIGGLGNQMFQYALLVGLRETFAEDIYADTTSFIDYKLHNGLELERIFPIQLFHSEQNIPHIKSLTLSRYINKYMPFLCGHCIYEYPDFRFNDAVYTKNQPNCYYSGYWHNYHYVEPFRDVLLKEYCFKQQLDEKNLGIVANMKKENSIGIHIRRGDYLKEKQYQGICDLLYYQSAVKIMKEKFSAPTFYIFSNDMEWCKSNIERITGADNTIYIDWNVGNDSYKDMQLMTHCQGLIIANSSFSWWGAFLNQRDSNIIISPKRWKNIKYDLKIQMPGWILV